MDEARFWLWVKIFDPRALIGIGMNSDFKWAKIRYTEGAELIDIIIDKDRIQSEQASWLHACLLMQSLFR